MDYEEFLKRKAPKTRLRGLSSVPALNSALFPHQRDTVDFLLRAGSGAAFLDTGLGKSFVQLEWARCVHEHENKPVLILAPLSVAQQTKREANRFGIDAVICRESADVKNAVCITNYESLHKFDTGQFCGVVLDESSILKSFTGVTTRKLIDAFADTKWRMAATATPAPNDHMELGQHSEFLGAMSSNEMLARWFIADQTQMGRYRLKGHAVAPYWEWVASWARCVGKPSDLGHSDEGFVLPELQETQHIVDVDLSIATNGLLFRIPDMSATAIHQEKRMTAEVRAQKVAQIVAADPDEPWLVWCDTDYEADALKLVIPDAVEVRGSDSLQKKEQAVEWFTNGTGRRVLISKPSIFGFGLNFQHCARVAFIGLSFSYESYYQAIRRCWRFGQKRPVQSHVVMAETERQIFLTIKRKADDHETMKREMFSAMQRAARIVTTKQAYAPTKRMEMPIWLKQA